MQMFIIQGDLSHFLGRLLLPKAITDQEQIERTEPKAIKEFLKSS